MLRVWFAGLAVLLIVPALGGPADAQDPMARMVELDVGDWWEFEISGRDQGTIRNEIDARGRHTNWFGETHDTYRVKATGTVTAEQDATGMGLPGAPVQVEIDVRKWVTVSDHAVVEIEGNSTAQGQDAIYSLESFDPPMVEAVYDFGIGWHWKVEVDYHNERDPPASDDAVDAIYGEFPVSYTAEVEAYEQVTVPAGTFNAWRVNMSSYRYSNAWTLQWYSETTCDIVKEERYDEQNNVINRLELSAYDCDGRPLPRPTYDPDHVTLLGRGEPLPSDWNEPPPTPRTEKNASPGSGWISILAALGASALAVGLLLARSRR